MSSVGTILEIAALMGMVLISFAFIGMQAFEGVRDRLTVQCMTCVACRHQVWQSARRIPQLQRFSERTVHADCGVFWRMGFPSSRLGSARASVHPYTRLRQ